MNDLNNLAAAQLTALVANQKRCKCGGTGLVAQKRQAYLADLYLPCPGCTAPAALAPVPVAVLRFTIKRKD